MRNSIARIINFIRGNRHFAVSVEQDNTYVGEGWTKTDAERSIQGTKFFLRQAQDMIRKQAEAAAAKAHADAMVKTGLARN